MDRHSILRTTESYPLAIDHSFYEHELPEASELYKHQIADGDDIFARLDEEIDFYSRSSAEDYEGRYFDVEDLYGRADDEYDYPRGSTTTTIPIRQIPIYGQFLKKGCCLAVITGSIQTPKSWTTRGTFALGRRSRTKLSTPGISTPPIYTTEETCNAVRNTKSTATRATILESEDHRSWLFEIRHPARPIFMKEISPLESSKNMATGLKRGVTTAIRGHLMERDDIWKDPSSNRS
ncbi:hypothetical protein BDZ97DRAFT_1754740 [Flammula alnicola]|nr:hypothetical protein BDZ97DRAFT_1754740 [Flammula alnicola]